MMIPDAIIQVLKDLEQGADLIDGNKAVNFGEIEKKVNVLLESSLNFEECLNLFSYTSKSFVHFQICKLLKNIVLQNVHNNNTESFIHLILHFIKNMPNVPYYVETALIEILCLLNKIFLANTSYLKESTLNMNVIVGELVSSNAYFMQKRGYLIMKATLYELLNESSNFTIGISHDKFKSLKIIFENNNLKGFMNLCVSSIGYYCQVDDAQWFQLISVIIPLMLELLSWRFLDINNSTSWHEIAYQSNLVEMLYKIISKIRLLSDYSDLEIEIFKCVSLLASIKVDGTESQQREFISKIIIFVLSSVSLPNITEKETFGVSCVIQNLVSRSNLGIYFIEKELLVKFLSVTSELTCFLCQFSADQDRITLEALDNLLQSWFALMNCEFSQNRDAINDIKSCTEKIFQCYLKSHISPPEGNRNISNAIKESQLEYDAEIEDTKDEVTFSDHLVITGMLGRFSVGKNLTFAMQCLISKTDLLKERFIIESESCLTNIYEDIHWILLMLAELMTDHDDIYNIIPSEIIKYSQSESVLNHESLLANPSNEFINIVKWIETFCNMEIEAQRLGFMLKFSPLLETSFLSFVTRFSSSYVMYKEDMYAELSICLATIFSSDSEYTPHMVQHLLEKVHFNLKVWNAEDKVIEKTLELFQDLTSNKEKNKICLNSTTFWEIAQESLADNSWTITQSNKIKLLTIIFSVIPLSDQNVLNNMEKVIFLLERRFKEITCSLTKSSTPDAFPEFRTNITACFDWLVAIIKSTNAKSCNHIFECFRHCWADIFIISNIFHCYEEIYEDIFKIYLEASQVFPSLLNEKNQAADLLESFISLLTVYAKHHRSPKEENFELLYLIENTFKNFLAIDFDNDPRFSVLTANILSIILPLVVPKTFEFPEGVSLFSSLISDLAEKHIQAFTILDERNCHKLIFLIEHILLGRYGTNAIESCLEFVKFYTEGLNENHNLQNHSFIFIGQRLLEMVFQMALCGDININSDTYTQIGSSLCRLVALFPQIYQKMTFEVISKSHNGPSLAEKFQKIFEELNCMSQIASEKNRIKHSQSIKTLLFETRRLVKA